MADFPSGRLRCWLTFAADFISDLAASHFCETTFRLQSRSTSNAFQGPPPSLWQGRSVSDLLIPVLV